MGPEEEEEEEEEEADNDVSLSSPLLHMVSDKKGSRRRCQNNDDKISTFA